MKVSHRLDPPFPIAVYASKSKRSASTGLASPTAPTPTKKPPIRTERPQSGALTDRGPKRQSAEQERPTFKAKVPRVIPSYKPNKPETQLQAQASPEPPTSHSSVRTLISETLRKEREANEEKAHALIQTQTLQLTRKVELQRRNLKIREENGRRFKTKSFQPVVAWGADERKVLGVEEEKVRKWAQEDRERRRKAKSSSKLSLGLEVYHQIRSEVLKSDRLLRGSSSIPSPLPQEPRPVHTPDPYLQAYMQIKRKLQAEEAFTQDMLSQEAEARRVLQLKQLESHSRLQLERFKYQQMHHKKKLRRRRRRRARAWDSSATPSEPEDEEVKLIMEQIDEDGDRDEPAEGRECRLFGIVDGETQKSQVVNATEIGNEVVARRSATPKTEIPRGSVSMPEIRPTDSLPGSRPSREAGEGGNSGNFSEEEDRDEHVRREVERKKEEMRRRLLELRSRMDRVHSSVPDDSYRPSIREETSEEQPGSSEDQGLSDSLLAPMQPASHTPHYSDSLPEQLPEDPPHFPGHISNIETKQDLTPIPIKTRIFDTLVGQTFSRESRIEMLEKLNTAKEDELRQLQLLAEQFPANERARALSELTKNLEDRYSLLIRLLEESQDSKKQDASDILEGLTPVAQPQHPVVEYVPSDRSQGDKSIHSPELSEIQADERRERDKTSEISGDLKFSFSERAILQAETEAIKEESQRPSLRSSPSQEIHEDTCEVAESDLVYFSADYCRPTNISPTPIEPPQIPTNPAILIQDWEESAPPSPPSHPSIPTEIAHKAAESLLETLVWELLGLPVMQTSVTSIVDNITKDLWSKLVGEVQVQEVRRGGLNLDLLVKTALEKGLERPKEMKTHLMTPLERNPLELLYILQETEVGQMILEDPISPPILPTAVLPYLEDNFPALDSEHPTFRLVIDGINESLSAYRLYGAKGVPVPWSKAKRVISTDFLLEEVCSRGKEQIRQWTGQCIGQIPTPDLILPTGQIDEDQLQTRREEKLSLALMKDLREREPTWTDYEAEETQVKLDLADMVLDHIITELFQVLGAGSR